MKNNIFIIVALILTLSSYVYADQLKDKIAPQAIFSNNLTPKVINNAVTIIIHGTIFPIISKLIHKVECPPGLMLAKLQSRKLTLGKIAYVLDKQSSSFPMDLTYLYGWSGKLSFKERIVAAQDLYDRIKDHRGPINIIAHSHGCNIALYLAKYAKKDNNKFFEINKLILLACPVQRATAKYVKSHIFKKVFSLYSTSDLTQVIDPQIIYKENNKNKKTGERVPLFSQRKFAPSPNIKQARILFNKKNLGHNDFLFTNFITRLPDIIETLEASDMNDCIINIPNLQFKSLDIAPLI